MKGGVNSGFAIFTIFGKCMFLTHVTQSGVAPDSCDPSCCYFPIGNFIYVGLLWYAHFEPGPNIWSPQTDAHFKFLKKN